MKTACVIRQIIYMNDLFYTHLALCMTALINPTAIPSFRLTNLSFRIFLVCGFILCRNLKISIIFSIRDYSYLPSTGTRIHYVTPLYLFSGRPSRYCVVFRFVHPRHNGQWLPTSKGFPSQILSITFCPILDVFYVAEVNNHILM